MKTWLLWQGLAHASEKNSLGSGFREKFRNHHGTQVFDYNLVTNSPDPSSKSYFLRGEPGDGVFFQNVALYSKGDSRKVFLRFPFVDPFLDVTNVD